MKRRIKVLAVIMAAVLMVSGAGSTLYENGVKADAKDTLKWNSAITKVKVKKRVALTVNVEASKVQWSVAGKNAATADLASANAYVSRLSRSSKRLSKKLLNAYCKKTGIKKRGCSGRDDLTGTNWSKIPVTLIECGFLSNPSEDRKLQNKSFQKKMAVGMANGVDAYFGY